jgi:isochorismate hydrolase
MNPRRFQTCILLISLIIFIACEKDSSNRCLLIGYGYETGGRYEITFEYSLNKAVLIKDEDAKVIKTYGDGFNKTDLDKIIKEKGSNTLFLCGLSAVGCVLATFIGAQNHDYRAYMVKNAVMSHNSDYTKNIEDMFDATPQRLIHADVNVNHNK